MPLTRRLFHVAILAAIALSPPLHADDGDCYEESRSLVIRPSWALLSLVVVATLAVALQRSSNCHLKHQKAFEQ